MTRTHILSSLLLASLLLVQACSQQHGGRKNKEIHKMTVGVGASYGYTYTVDGKFNGMVFALVSIPISDWGEGFQEAAKA